MEPKFIKYKQEEVNLVQLYRISSGSEFGNKDVLDGTLVIGYYGDGKYLAMGYLRGMTPEDGELTYRIANAVDGEVTAFIKKAYRADYTRLPYVAAVSDSSKKPIVGRILKCNGEHAIIYDGCGETAVDVNSIYRLTPYFEETKE